MLEVSGDLAERPVLEVLRALHERDASGVLEIDPAGHRRRLYLRDGELHLPGGHPLARRLSEQMADLRRDLQQGTGGARQETRRQLLELVERIAAVLLEWRRGAFRFSEGQGALPADLVGPLPTRRLIMIGATCGVDDTELARRLGGDSSRLVAVAPESATTRDLLGFSPEELFLLERLRAPMTVGDLLRDSPVPRADLTRRLAQLLAAGLVQAIGARGAAAVDTAEDPESAVVQRLGERIARSLEDEPVVLEPETHRARLADLLARIGGLNHYELLEVPTSATAEEVHAGYERLGRLAHPANAARLGLTTREEGLRLLFDRATRAYVTLIDPERRRLYNQAELIELTTSAVSGSERLQERRQMARANYERGIAYAAASEFHFAVELLDQAVRADPRPEYWVALGRVQARNPNWRGRAIESYRAALELEPDNAEVRFALGLLYEQTEDPERARVQFTAVVRLNPAHAEAAERLAKLEPKRGGRSAGGSLFDRIFRRS